jgi:FkbM family methyltransferase
MNSPGTTSHKASSQIVLPRPLGTLGFVAAWFVPWRPAFRTTAAQSKLKFHAHHRDAIGRHIAKYGTHEPLVTRWMAEFLNAAPRGIVIDIGANLGWHALHAARHPKAETVVAFEPDPFNAWLLERNLAANDIDNVIVESRAVGAAPGTAHLHRYNRNNFGRHSLAADHGQGSRTVPVTDLDGALAALGLSERPISLIKIDVEGYEPKVIDGAVQTLQRTDGLILEYSPDLSAAGGLSTTTMLAQLKNAGFSPFVLWSKGGTVRIEASELEGFAGSLDVIWVKTARLAALAGGMNERDRGGVSLAAIAEANKRIVKPI